MPMNSFVLRELLLICFGTRCSWPVALTIQPSSRAVEQKSESSSRRKGVWSWFSLRKIPPPSCGKVTAREFWPCRREKNVFSFYTRVLIFQIPIPCGNKLAVVQGEFTANKVRRTVMGKDIWYDGKFGSFWCSCRLGARISQLQVGKDIV